MKRRLVLTTAVLALSLAPPATAGEYEVRSCDGSYGNSAWQADVDNGYVTAYSSCPGEGIVTRSSGGAEYAPNLVDAYHQLNAPPGTRIVRLRGDFRFHSQNGWVIGFVDDTPRWAWCGRSCTSFGSYCVHRHRPEHLLDPGERRLLHVQRLPALPAVRDPRHAQRRRHDQRPHAAGRRDHGRVAGRAGVAARQPGRSALRHRMRPASGRSS